MIGAIVRVASETTGWEAPPAAQARSQSRERRRHFPEIQPGQTSAEESAPLEWPHSPRPQTPQRSEIARQSPAAAEPAARTPGEPPPHTARAGLRQLPLVLPG